MRLFVTGASSFVGAHFCRLAAARGHDVIGLWRHTKLALPGVTSLQGDVTTVALPPGVDVVVHLAAKVMAADARAQNRAMMSAVLGWGRPVAYASSTVVHWPRTSDYADARVEDEARLEGSGLPWLTLRPCAPYGPVLADHTPAHVESFHRLAALVKRLPVIPVVGSGRYRRQPVHVDDFNGALLALLDRGVWGTALDAGAPEPLTMRALLHTLARAAGHRIVVVPVPATLAAAGARMVPGLDPALIRDFATDDVVDPAPLAALSGVRPRSFADGVGCLYPPNGAANRP